MLLDSDSEIQTPVADPPTPDPTIGMAAEDAERFRTIRSRQAALVELLNQFSLDAILLRDPANFRWLTAGAEMPLNANLDAAGAAILVTSEAKVVLCDNSRTTQLFDGELAEMGFLLKQRPWTEDPGILLDDVCRGRRMGTDLSHRDLQFLGQQVAKLRLPRSEHEIRQLRKLGSDLTHAVEATARCFVSGESEAEVAAQVAHRMIKRGVEPIQLQVFADGQNELHRQSRFGTARCTRQCVIHAVGRRQGMHLGVTRTISLGSPDRRLTEDYQLAAFVLATGMRFSQANSSLSELWSKLARIYEKFDRPDEWRCAEQAMLTGYSPSEVRIVPQLEGAIPDRSAVLWQPSVGGAMVGNTVLARDGGFEPLTVSRDWPMLSIRTGSDLISVPGILIREVTG